MFPINNKYGIMESHYITFTIKGVQEIVTCRTQVLVCFIMAFSHAAPKIWNSMQVSCELIYERFQIKNQNITFQGSFSVVISCLFFIIIIIQFFYCVLLLLLINVIL